jgi:glucose-1-phosphate thymidylyltransferase
MKGIVLAGGEGTRLWPLTKSVSKQLLPVHDKPMIYYPLSTLALAGIREILVICKPTDLALFQKTLEFLTDIGIEILFAEQLKPGGIAEALIIGEEFLGGDDCALILGDNLFYGSGLGSELKIETHNFTGARIFSYEVHNPSEYGVVTLDKQGKPLSLVEKPVNSESKLAITGLYFLDNKCSQIAKEINPSPRGELEIVNVLEHYLKMGELSVNQLTRGTAWFDTGTIKSLYDASTFIGAIESRTGLKIGCLEEISFRNGWISIDKLRAITKNYPNENYRDYLLRISD